jgi:2-haloalkanoic acid dehalogenase type II
MGEKYDWVSFDCYGTLIDWENGICAAFEKVAKASGSAFDRDRILGLFARFEAEEELSYRRYREILNRVARRICAEMGYRTSDYTFLSESLARWRPFADTNPVLERLARSHKLAVLSNVDNDLLMETRRHFTVNFDLVVTAEKVAGYKPDVRHFQEARRTIGNQRWVHAAQSWYHDVVPCSRLKIDCAWINRKDEPPKDPKIPTVLNKPHLVAFANWLEGVD